MIPLWSTTTFFKIPSLFSLFSRGIIITLVLGGISAGCGSPSSDSPKDSSKGTILFPHSDQSAQEQHPRVKLIRVAKANWSPELVSAGTVSPFRTAIKFALPGRVLRIFVQEGDKVIAGQEAAELDPGPILREIEIAVSLRNRLNQELQQTAQKISLNNQTDKTTRDSLSGSPTLPPSTTDSNYSVDLESENLQLTENLQALKKQLAETEKKLEDLKKSQEKTSLRCPINGYIETLEVSPGDQVTPGKVLAVVKDVKQLEINLFLPKKKRNFILKAKEAEVKIDSFPGEVFFGKIVHTSIYILPDERISVKIKLPYSAGKIRPGMRGKVVMAGQQLENVCLLPIGAIMKDALGKFAYQFIDGEIIRKPVKLGHRSKEAAVIVDGLKEGALIVANPTDDLKPGTRVIPDIIQ